MFQQAKGPKIPKPAPQLEAPSVEKLKPENPTAPAKPTNQSEGESETAAEEGPPTQPFEPEMLPHLDMSNEEIG